jgi:hypothetical protein
MKTIKRDEGRSEDKEYKSIDKLFSTIIKVETIQLKYDICFLSQ